MEDREYIKKLKAYSERQRFWENQAISQLGYSINLITTIAITFLTYQLNTSNKSFEFKIDFDLPIKWDMTFNLISIFASLITVLLGLVSITSRLFDIRITRHIISTRKKAYKKSKTLLPENSFEKNNLSKTSNYLKTLIKNIQLIEPQHFDSKEELKKNFNKLRKQSFLLGEFTWKTHRLQLLIFLFAIIFYFLTQILK